MREPPTPERWHQIETIYHAAMQRDPDTRAAFVMSVCRDDPDLRAEVESLLAQPVSQDGAFLSLSGDALRPGAAPNRIGDYELQDLLGAGGMGEVYRARDTRLGRLVAIKLLPLAFAADRDRLSRFEREARLLASLNHPNIGTVYGLEPCDGAVALVMELVDGKDLSERIRPGPVPVRDALAIAQQIAMGLEAAHAQGVIHRDLKPANIKVRPDDAVKILDFGLAKALPSGDPAVLTQISPATESGLLLGTPSYMSPEQARGEAVDRQADIWAFGVVLYELLTGVAPFAGKTTAETLAHVLERSPDLDQLPVDTPPAVRRLISRCLEKDRRRRLQHIGDARLEIDDALATTEPAPSDRAAVAPRVRWWQVAAAIPALLLLVGIGFWRLVPSAAAPARGPTLWLTISAIGAPVSTPYGTRHLAITRDGAKLAFASVNGILIRALRQKDSVTLSATGTDPFFSPDGEWIAFFGGANGERGLMKTPVAGGPVTRVTLTSERTGGGTWRADGTIVFATTEGLYRVSAKGGEPTLLAKPDSNQRERVFAWPEFMPDGRSVVFTIEREGTAETAQIAWLDLQTQERRVVLEGGTAAQLTSDGQLVYASGTILKRVAFDAKTGMTGGAALPVPDVALATTRDNGAADFAVSDTGTLVFASATSSSSTARAPVWVDRAGHEEPLALAPGPYIYPRISPDGTRVAFDMPGPISRNIGIFDVARKSLARLTDGMNEDISPEWSIDGRLFFASNRAASIDLYSQAADGATPAQLVFAAPGAQFPTGFTPDGTRLVVAEQFKDLSVLELAHPDRLHPLLHGRFIYRLGVISPNGKWIAYESDESGEPFEVFVRPFPDVTGRRAQVSSGGGRFPLWASDSRELFYVDNNGTMMSVAVTFEPTFTFGTVTPLFAAEKPRPGVSGRPYDISPLDHRFLISRPVTRTPAEPVDITVILNGLDQHR